MRQLLSVCYIAFMAFINGVSLWKDLTMRGYPLWIIIFGLITNITGFIAMLLWAFDYESNGRLFWKIVPFGLVAFYATAWYFDFVLYRKPYFNFTNQIISAATVLGLLIFFPLFYSTFKFGFGDRE